MDYGLCYTEFIEQAKQFITIANNVNDDWKLVENDQDNYSIYLKKEMCKEVIIGQEKTLLKAEYIVSYNLSYGVPMFSFNFWKPTGMLLTLEDIRKLSLIIIKEKDFYSVITQQEHPLLHRPFFIVHPCHTGTLISVFKNTSKNLIITFLSQLAPLMRLDLSLEYAM